MLRVVVVPVLSDNYSYLLVRAGRAIAVDPAHADTVLAAAAREQCTVEAVLTTHHHHDHAGGNEAFLALGGVAVYGGDDRIPTNQPRLHPGQTLRLLDAVDVRVVAAPCHTTGHVLYHVDDLHLFTGDTLFVGGCGRFFEGTAAQMHCNLSTIAQLPDHTLLWVGHAYGEANLLFAAHADPGNVAVAAKLAWVREQQERGLPEVPSTVGEEKLYNPFVRLPALAATPEEAVARMAELREAKNVFKAV